MRRDGEQRVAAGVLAEQVACRNHQTILQGVHERWLILSNLCRRCWGQGVHVMVCREGA